MRHPIGYIKGRPIFPIMGGSGTTEIQALQAERTQLISEVEPLAAAVEGGAMLDSEQRTALRTAVERKREIDEKLAELKGDGDLLAEIKAAREAEIAETAKRRESARQPIYGDPKPDEPDDSFLTLGEAFTKSDAYRAMMKQYPNGIPEGNSYQSEAVLVPAMRALLGLQTPTERAKLRAATLLTSADSTAGGIGTLVNPMLLGLLEPGDTRELTLRDLVTVMPTTTDSWEYVREVTRGVGEAYVTGAAIVPEATSLSGTVGLKPGGVVDFEKKTGTVVTIAEWIAATRRILSDAGFLRNYIDAFLRDDVALKVEDQMIGGDGTGDNFLGIMNDPDVQEVDATDFDNVYDAIRHAIALARVVGRTRRPLALAAHPYDSEYMDTRKAGAGAAGDGGGQYYSGGPFNPRTTGPWRLREVETEGATENTVIVGDFSRALLVDREDTNISVGTINDDFLRNIVRVLAEGRWGFSLIRPQAFVKVINFKS